MLFAVFIVVMLTLGAFLGIWVADLQQLKISALLNLVGLTYDFLGVAVLSEVVVKSTRWKRFFVSWGAGAILWGQTLFPLGALLGIWLVPMAPSANLAMAFFKGVLIWSFLPLAFLEAKVVNVRFPANVDLSLRARMLGIWLIIIGIFLQIVGAAMDVVSS